MLSIKHLLLATASDEWITKRYTYWITRFTTQYSTQWTTEWSYEVTSTKTVPNPDYKPPRPPGGRIPSSYSFQFDGDTGGAIEVKPGVVLTADEQKLLYFANCYYWGAVTPSGGKPSRSDLEASWVAIHGGGPSDGSFYGVPSVLRHDEAGYPNYAPGWGGAYGTYLLAYNIAKQKVAKGIYEGEETLTASQVQQGHASQLSNCLSLAGASSISSKVVAISMTSGNTSFSWSYSG